MKRFLSASLIAALCTVSLGCPHGSNDQNSGTTADTPKTTSGNHDPGGPISEQRLGVKIYPGAKIVTSGETDEVVSANLFTSDPAEKVVKFYAQELGAEYSGVKLSIMGEKNGRKYAISIIPDTGGTSVAILGKK